MGRASRGGGAKRRAFASLRAQPDIPTGRKWEQSRRGLMIQSVAFYSCILCKLAVTNFSVSSAMYWQGW